MLLLSVQVVIFGESRALTIRDAMAPNGPSLFVGVLSLELPKKILLWATTFFIFARTKG